jgi:hypothetical protein
MNPICRWIVWIRVSDTMRADALHDAAITAPVLRPLAHMVIGWIVNTAILSPALVLIVNAKDAIRSD